MTVDEYLDAAPEPQRTTLRALRLTLRRLLPGAEETISYGMPAFMLKGKAVAGYAYFRGHCSYFPHSGSVLEEAADDLSAYEWSKGTLRFPIGESLPEPLVRRLVEVRREHLGI
ncbi:MAG: iron chaperone [Actinomycetota bacterium]